MLRRIQGRARRSRSVASVAAVSGLAQLFCACASSAPPASATPTLTVPSAEVGLPDGDLAGRAGETAPASFVSVVQDQQVTPVSSRRGLSLRRGPCALRFELDHYDEEESLFFAARILVTAGSQPEFVPLGRIDDEHPFGPGRGFAAGSQGYTTWQLEPDGFHYVTTHPQREDLERCRIVRSLGPQRSLVEVDVRAVYFPETGLHYPIERMPMESLSFVVFIDRNLDEVVADDEIAAFALSFGAAPR